jgi:hypothetical protein
MKSTDLTWDGDEPAAAVAEEEPAPAAKESAPAPQAESRDADRRSDIAGGQHRRGCVLCSGESNPEE